MSTKNGISQQTEKPVRLKNVLILLALLPVFGIVAYGLHSIGLDITPGARLQTTKENLMHNEIKTLSQLDESETRDFRESFVKECKDGVIDQLSDSKADRYCSCTEQRVEQNFTIKEVNDWQNQSSDEVGQVLNPHYKQCASELGLSKN
jgi:hypothetical protein